MEPPARRELRENLAEEASKVTLVNRAMWVNRVTQEMLVLREFKDQLDPMDLKETKVILETRVQKENREPTGKRETR